MNVSVSVPEGSLSTGKRHSCWIYVVLVSVFTVLSYIGLLLLHMADTGDLSLDSVPLFKTIICLFFLLLGGVPYAAWMDLSPFTSWIHMLYVLPVYFSIIFLVVFLPSDATNRYCRYVARYRIQLAIGAHMTVSTIIAVRVFLLACKM